MGTNTTTRPRAAGVRLATALVVSILAGPADAQDGTSGEWRVHGGDSGFTRYAPLEQINADTVNDLEIIWRRPAVDATLHARWPGLRYSNELRSTPLMVDGVLYASNGIGMVEAFDPATGESIWVQALGVPRRRDPAWCRQPWGRLLGGRGWIIAAHSVGPATVSARHRRRDRQVDPGFRRRRGGGSAGLRRHARADRLPLELAAARGARRRDRGLGDGRPPADQGAAARLRARLRRAHRRAAMDLESDPPGR